MNSHTRCRNTDTGKKGERMKKEKIQKNEKLEQKDVGRAVKAYSPTE